MKNKDTYKKNQDGSVEVLLEVEDDNGKKVHSEIRRFTKEEVKKKLKMCDDALARDDLGPEAREIAEACKAKWEKVK